MIFLKLDHEVLGLNWGTLVPFVPESRGTSKASKLVSSKKQINLIREKLHCIQKSAHEVLGTFLGTRVLSLFTHKIIYFVYKSLQVCI